jgi:hypothetical protein
MAKRGNMRYHVFKDKNVRQPAFTAPWQWLATWLTQAVSISWDACRIEDTKRGVTILDWARAIPAPSGSGYLTPKSYSDALSHIKARCPDAERQVVNAINEGKVPLIIGLSGSGKTLLACHVLKQYRSVEEHLKFAEAMNRYHQKGAKLSREDYFKPIENGALLIDELTLYEQGDDLLGVLALAISHQMRVVMTAQTTTDVDDVLLKDERISLVYLR